MSAAPRETPEISAVVLAWGEEPWLERCVEAVLASEGVSVELLCVDNGCTSAALRRVASRAGVRVLRPGRNLGFAGGCNLAAAHARGAFVALVNSDAIVDPHALRRLADVAGRDDVGIATSSLRLAEDPERLNSAGNPVHFLGLTWSGAFGEPAAEHAEERDVAAASGACAVLRRQVWDDLGGFDPVYFAYHEDVELSLRCWQRGLRVVYVPDAVAVHHYEFSRHPSKMYLLERNRHLLVLTAFSARTLALTAPALVAFEAMVLLAAVVQGWWRQKLRAWCWVACHTGWVRARRRRLQRERTVPDALIAPLLSGRLDPGNVALPPGLRWVSATFDGYWRLARRLL